MAHRLDVGMSTTGLKMAVIVQVRERDALINNIRVI